MCLAIRKLGKKLIESSDVVVYHHRRSLFKLHLKQVSRFGEHRGFFAKKFPENSKKMTYFFPSLLLSSLLIGILLSVIFSFFTYIVIFGLVAYFISTLIAAAVQVENVKMTLSVWLGIIATHLVYGTFFISGLAKRDLKR
jgi:vacuolar-type H+-ATPase subunit I/STV1